MWVANTLDSTVSLIDTRSDTVVLTRAVRGAPEAVAATGSSVWIAGGTPQLTLLSSTGSTTAVTTPSTVDALAVDAGKLFVGVVGNGVDHRGGTVRARISDPQFEPFDPAACCDIPSNVLGLSYDGLLALSKSPSDPGRLVPDLALAIPAAQDGGRIYTFACVQGSLLERSTGPRLGLVRGFERAAGDPTWAGYLGALPRRERVSEYEIMQPRLRHPGQQPGSDGHVPAHTSDPGLRPRRAAGLRTGPLAPVRPGTGRTDR